MGWMYLEQHIEGYWVTGTTNPGDIKWRDFQKHKGQLGAELSSSKSKGVRHIIAISAFESVLQLDSLFGWGLLTLWYAKLSNVSRSQVVHSLQLAFLALFYSPFPPCILTQVITKVVWSETRCWSKKKREEKWGWHCALKISKCTTNTHRRKPSGKSGPLSREEELSTGKLLSSQDHLTQHRRKEPEKTLQSVKWNHLAHKFSSLCLFLCTFFSPRIKMKRFCVRYLLFPSSH